MKKSVSEIIDAVKICIDEIGLNDAEFEEGQDNVEMDTIIRSKIIDALRFINGNADWSMIEPNAVLTQASEAVSINENLIGIVRLPENFMRLCYARFSSWPLYLSSEHIIYWNETEYATLSDQYATGTYERPKIAMVLTPERILQMYKAKTAEDDAVVGILTEPAISKNEEGDETLDISPKLLQSLIYYISGLTLLTYKDEHADSMFNQAMVLAGITPSTHE
ncbi:hypothetical protein [uncultured Bacteroides sp.]|uniref:hypothetical protein n=1 Tax=uncultured Bacteroides sp. TaxID=162156 RepID=UPI00262906B2|nr:hypothetical protein [uncultured Bacteroides sp.]